MSFLDPIGRWIKANVIEPLSDAYKSFTGALLPVLRELPGGQAVEDAINQGAAWVKVLVDLPGADLVLKAMAMLTYGPIAHALGGTAWFGPQIASAVWALPGVVRGQDFLTAWAYEVKDRFEKIAEIYGPGIVKDQLQSIVPDTFRFLGREASFRFPNLPIEEAIRRIDITPEDLARRFNIGVILPDGKVVYRPDIAALILNAKTDQKLYDLDAFDLQTGERPKLFQRDPRPQNPELSSVAIFTQARRDKLPGGVSVGDLSQVATPTNGAAPSQSLTLTLLDSVADLALLAGFTGGLYLFGRAAWNSRHRGLKKARAKR